MSPGIGRVLSFSNISLMVMDLSGRGREAVLLQALPPVSGVQDFTSRNPHRLQLGFWENKHILFPQLARSQDLYTCEWLGPSIELKTSALGLQTASSNTELMLTRRQNLKKI